MSIFIATQKGNVINADNGSKFAQYENAVAKHINSYLLAKAEKRKNCLNFA